MSPIIWAPLSSSNHDGIHSAASISNTPIVPERPPSPEKKAFHDSNTFLTALAAQERRVLELKEELQKAEVDLEKLKKQWATHEAAKQRNELRQLEPLQPLLAPSTNMNTYGESDAARMTREQERRKLKPITTRQPQRTVFSNSRHTKTLSLLSPILPSEGYIYVSDTRVSAKMRRGTTDGLPRSRAIPDMSAPAASSSCQPNATSSRQLTQGQSRDDIVDTGRQLIGDLREGLWTLFEDLRQATVGEDIDTIARGAPKKMAGNQKSDDESKATLSKCHDTKQPQIPARGPSLYEKPSILDTAAAEVGVMKDHHVKSSPPATKSKHQPHMTIQTIPPESDGWDNWDSSPRQSSPLQSSMKSRGLDSLASPVTDCSTPRTSIR